jgi:hypothetical protein
LMPASRDCIPFLLIALLYAGCGDAGRLDSTCNANSDCQPTEFCASGFCGGYGECKTRPETCDESELSLVCGCDGRTYQNSCFAEQAGVRLATTTACVCADNDACVDGQFCASDTSCTDAGFCAQPPEACESVVELVCGCNFVTYNNACEAAQAGVRVSAEGMCECQTNEDCDPSTEYCNAAVCDGPGVCDLRNDPACMPEGPVTDCDGVVYENACVAAEQGVRVRPE